LITTQRALLKQVGITLRGLMKQSKGLLPPTQAILNLKAMSEAFKPRVGVPVAPMRFETVDGESVTIGAPKERWTMLFVYRGQRCRRCKKFLNKLNAALPEWRAVMDVVVISADTFYKARADKDAFGWEFELAYGLSEPQMRALGLYVSDPLSEAETTMRFAEPGAFGLRPVGTLMLVDISNGPAARPDLEELLDGMIFNIKNDRPVRGTA
jgi:peroxiredoxin